MKCPHCLVSFHEEWTSYHIVHRNTGTDKELWSTKCPACNRLVLELKTLQAGVAQVRLFPKATARPVSPDVPNQYAQDYREACLVLTDSAKASAALSRRCLQNILRDVAKVKPSDLSKEIDEVLNSGKLPSHLGEGIDAVRNIGNFGAHPIKSTNTGTVIEVEPGEAEWLLDLLEGIFDFYFVQPASLQKKKDALNQKLKDAGKPPMK